MKLQLLRHAAPLLLMGAGVCAQPTATGSEPAPDLIRGQAYPARPVRVVVNVTAGGGVDMTARVSPNTSTPYSIRRLWVITAQAPAAA